MNKQSGFTLIEIVMVLVLLGILSAVAVPKYFDLQKQAEMRAAQAAVAEVQARINATFAQGLLEGKTCSNAIVAAQNAVNGVAMGQWKVSWTLETTGSGANKETDYAKIKSYTIERQDNAGAWQEIDMTKLAQEYAVNLVLPACSDSSKVKTPETSGS